MKSIKLLLLASLLVFTGCDAEDTFTTIKQSIDEDTIWVFAQINIPVEDDKIEDYYYYGRIKNDIYDLMVDGQLKDGFILFRDIRYWNDDNKVEKFENEADAGDITFRIEHIVKIDLSKGDPFILENSKEAPEM
jgi:hypothetical protein